MIELCLFLFYIYTVYLIRPKSNLKKWNNSAFTLDSIRLEDIQNNVDEAEKKYFDLAMKAYAQIVERIQGKTVVEIQIYGLEFLYMKDSRGAFQLAIAKILREKFHAELIYTHPRLHYPAEMECFKHEKISFYHESEFSIERNHETISKAKDKNAVIICYFSRQSYAYFSFCDVSWDPEIMKHLVFVTSNNTPGHYSNIYISEEKEKVLKWCDEVPIVIEWPRQNGMKYGSVLTFADVREAVLEAQKSCFHSELLAYTQIMSVLEGKTIVQIQMYGLGNICPASTNGSIQLAVALKLCKKFKERYPGLSLTSQEPTMYPAEIEYLKSLNITVFDGEKFCSSRILNPENVSNPMIIVYCIHFPPSAFEGFLEAHWGAKLLSQIIFVSNSGPDYPWGKKSWYYSRWCKSKPIVEDNPAHCVTNEERRNWFAFASTSIHTVSYENAKQMIKCCG